MNDNGFFDLLASSMPKNRKKAMIGQETFLQSFPRYVTDTVYFF